VLVKLVRRIFALQIVAAYLGATLVAAASAIGSCPVLDDAPRNAHHHHSGPHPHHQGSPSKTAGECLKCCLGACLVAPCLPSPTGGFAELAFVGLPVLYWAVSPAIYGRAITPDPGPPKPIT
jgi:hypothetical protein